MFKISTILLAIFLAASSVYAEDFILRATSDCCETYPDFQPGSMAALMKHNKVVVKSTLSKEAPFEFKDIIRGKYDLVVSAAGYFPDKFLRVDFGSKGVVDYELAVALIPTSTSILDGQLIVRFSKIMSDSIITSRLEKWDLGIQQMDRKEDSGELKYRIIRSYDYAEARVTYDRSRNVSEIMTEVLLDPSVIKCAPIYFGL